MLAVWDLRPVFDRKEVADLLGPLNTSPSGCVVPIISSPRQAWINEYRDRYVLVQALFRFKLDRNRCESFFSPLPQGMFEGLDRIVELAMPLASTGPGSLSSRSRWRVSTPGKAPSLQATLFVPVLLSRFP